MMSGEMTVCVSMPCRARPGRLLDAGFSVQAAIGICLRWPVPWVAMSGSHAWPVVITACSCRRIAAAMTVWAWVAVSLFCSRLVRCR